MDVNAINKHRYDAISEFVSLEQKNVLEIGCGNGDLLKYIAEHASVKHITGIEYWTDKEEAGNNYSIQKGNAECMDFGDNSFDAIYSFHTFEHIGDIAKALLEIKRILKPYGKFYTQFNPIWTSIAGHHYGSKNAYSWNRELIKRIPPWGHLYMNEDEMKNHLIKVNVEEKEAEEILSFIYHSSIINRFTRSDFLQCLTNCGMVIRQYQESVAFNRFVTSGTIEANMSSESELTSDIITRLQNTRYDLNDIGVTAIRIVLEKYESI